MASNRFFVIRALNALLNRGLSYCISYSLCYAYLWVSRCLKKRRLDLYDFNARQDPEKLSFFAPQKEWQLESPQERSYLDENADEIYLLGVNSSSEYLSVSVSRKPNSLVHCSLMLRLKTGQTYTLPDEHIVQKETEEANTYGSARLKLECLQAMRRWRIFFNGILREESAGGESLKTKHVKLAFIWVPSSNIFDNTTDYSISSMAHVAAMNKYEFWHPLLYIEKLINICNGYSQAGMMLGQVEVENEPPVEIYLWGYRDHNMGKVCNFESGRITEYSTNAENGMLLHMRTLDLPRTVMNFHHGFIMLADGHVFPIDECSVQNQEKSIQLTCYSNDLTHHINIEPETAGHSFRNQFNSETRFRACKAQFNGMSARGVLSDMSIGRFQRFATVPAPQGLTKEKETLTLPIEDPRCENSEMTGGKGSSLAKLYSFSAKNKNALMLADRYFQVPKGIVVTTDAYEKFTFGQLKNSIQHFQKDVWNQNSDNYSDLCEKIMEQIINTDLPNAVIKSVKQDLIKIFGKDFGDIKFAVRSSAIGEDTEQLSAAGQMDTFLGVKGFDEILKALKKCWASQFGFVAVQYKRRYGQLIDTPMAVVIQEMVPCDVAGVLFTCDPVTGNPAYITISANYGLGESVVGASSEPDTIKLERNLKNEVKIYSKDVGSKKSKIVMSGTDGVTSVDLGSNESSTCCLSDEICIKMAEIAVEIENHYGTPRDIEWGVLGDQIFLLQSRPITSIAIETDYEIRHAQDSYMRREDEYTTKANVGEVLNGSSSTLGLEVMAKLAIVAYPRHQHMKGLLSEAINSPPYYPNGIKVISGHVIFILADAFFRFSDSKEGDSSDYTKAMSVAILGRVLDDKRLFQIAADRHPKNTRMPFLGGIIITLMMFLAGWRNRKVKKQMEKINIPIKESDTAQQIFDAVSKHYDEFDISMVSHMECTFASSFWNLVTLSLLAKEEKDWDNNVFGDFAYLLSTCSQVESADVPSAIERLGYTISKSIKPAEFKNMSEEDALNWLLSTNSKAGVQFKEFLTKHGHRGIKEFDAYVMPWRLNQKPLIQMLQSMVSDNVKDSTERKVMSAKEIISNLHVKLGFLSRLKLRFLLPNCQRCVREREFSKSVLVKQFDKIRQAYLCLAKAMVREGRLPNEELLFFLNTDEVRRLLQTRSPRLVSVAFRRWKCHPELDKLIFPEICIGIPKPVNMNEDISDADSDLCMTGVPVSHGAATARACVILSVQEASLIQDGDVLITYATDIGWSPYFPLLSGVVTELGGLVSHGAVVAREYGLPCVVNLHGATRVFKTGDTVRLDGNKGTLKRLQSVKEVSKE